MSTVLGIRIIQRSACCLQVERATNLAAERGLTNVEFKCARARAAARLARGGVPGRDGGVGVLR